MRGLKLNTGLEVWPQQCRVLQMGHPQPLWQSGPVSHHRDSKELLANAQSNPAVFLFEAILLVLSLHGLVTSASPDLV